MSVTRMALVIVNWNTRDLLRTCLESARTQEADEIVVADNGSTDGSVEMVAQDFPAVRLMVNPKNPGYGAACNAAISSCRAEYVLLLNSDTVLRAGALEALSLYLDRHPRAAIVGPRLRNPDGTLQRSCFPFPSPVVPLLKRRPVAPFVGRVAALRERYVGRFGHDESSRVPWVLGAALAVRRTAFEEVGGFDESFVMYFEEVDLCRRLQERGWETHFAPVTDVTHVGGASTRQRRVEMLVRLSLSSIAFHRHHRRGAELALALGVERTIVAGRLLRDLFRYYVASGAGRERLRENLRAWREVLRRSAHHPQP